MVKTMKKKLKKKKKKNHLKTLLIQVCVGWVGLVKFSTQLNPSCVESRNQPNPSWVRLGVVHTYFMRCKKLGISLG